MKKIILIGILLTFGWISKSNILNIPSNNKGTSKLISDEYISTVNVEDTISDEEIELIMNSYSDYEDKLYRPKKTHNNVLKSEKSIVQKRKFMHTKKNKFKCDNRKYCSQMHSYEEAKYFLRHCPNVKIDGDRDGIPCERQFHKYY